MIEFLHLLLKFHAYIISGLGQNLKYCMSTSTEKYCKMFVATLLLDFNFVKDWNDVETRTFEKVLNSTRPCSPISFFSNISEKRTP